MALDPAPHLSWNVEQAPTDLRSPILLAAFEGWNDAGEASSSAARYLRDHFEAAHVATINAEDFFDFTVARPTVCLDEDDIRQIIWPSTEIYVAHVPGAAHDLVCAIGHEPQLRWRTFVDHVACIAKTLDTVGHGVTGYVTPKVTVGAVVGNDAGEILLVQRAQSGVWLYPTGFCDVGYSASEVVVKEVLEETGIECQVVKPIAILDGLRLGITGVPLYSLVFLCRMTGGELKAHPLECLDVGFFPEGELPEDTAIPDQWAAESFAAIRGESIEIRFDLPRDPPWAGDMEHG